LYLSDYNLLIGAAGLLGFAAFFVFFVIAVGNLQRHA
jgi:hypothetical protein